ncbi:ATP-dependent Clp protease proteolytic subunit-related protein 3, chloroplastic-like [Zingiber officinale]|uniref:ATP-dependent Clp protease proteolytic subunit n=1 Tax=Zingiber officinale TaxID=94328 RepID=A0A8J5L537_ZINOF|nr:ATP-dependent Clp protease proteolytic subunit-related protein 3, chloroplastic-like [Zingiber officinale]KAG6501115.1 hypothetical protein ZIOFF_040983 [Zingiber officinale]
MACGAVSFRFLSPRMPLAFVPSGLSSSPPSSSFSMSADSAAPLKIRAARAPPPMPPLNPRDPFLSKLAEAAAAAPDPLALASSGNRDMPPYLDLFASPTLMASPAQVERSVSYNEHRPRRPPPDLPSLLLHGRIVYIGMPLVPVVTELVIAQLLYLQWMDAKEPIFIYINSTGTTRDDGETVALETEGFAIYDAMKHIKNEIETVAVGAAIGHACLILAAGKKGRRFAMPHAQTMIQQPRLPSTGLMQASDVIIRAEEALKNRDTFVKLLARHTGNSVDTIKSAIHQGPYYMDTIQAKEFGVIDKILWRGQEKIMADALSPDEWDQRAGVKPVDAF